MGCVLRITGKDFDVDGFLNATGLNPYLKFKIGDSVIGKKKKSEANGCYFDISDKGFNDLGLQIKDATAYLKLNFERLNKLSQYNLREEEVAILDFGIETRMNEVAVQVDRFPVELIKLCGVLGFDIELSQYLPSGEEDSSI